jgi:hypothetical protein
MAGAQAVSVDAIFHHLLSEVRDDIVDLQESPNSRPGHFPGPTTAPGKRLLLRAAEAMHGYWGEGHAP